MTMTQEGMDLLETVRSAGWQTDDGIPINLPGMRRAILAIEAEAAIAEGERAESEWYEFAQFVEDTSNDPHLVARAKNLLDARAALTGGPNDE
jgi:hypothetical protein